MLRKYLYSLKQAELALFYFKISSLKNKYNNLIFVKIQGIFFRRYFLVLELFLFSQYVNFVFKSGYYR